MDDSPAAIAAQALKFLGLLITVGGALAILRTGERSIFYALMMPIGLILWGIGFWLTGRIERHAPTQSHDEAHKDDHHA